MRRIASSQGDTFLDSGSIKPPGPIGRLARLSFGIGSLYLVVQVIGVSNARALLNPTVIAFSLFAVYLVGYVVNIGTGLRLGASPRIVAVVGLALAGMMGWAMDGILTSDVLWRAIRWFMIYVYGHLGVSFVLAAAFATPGCEMRSIPILIGRLTGKPPRDHHCPGPIDAIDRWEAEQSEIG